MDNQQVWDYYFAAIVGWQFHPGNHREPLTLEECAEFVNNMMKVRAEKCLG